MSDKNYAEVNIAGKVYKIGGSEDEEYLRKVAGYLNGKIDALKETPGYNRMNADTRTLMLHLNVAEDYFFMKDRMETMESRLEELEKQNDELKHELVQLQMQKEKGKNA